MKMDAWERRREQEQCEHIIRCKKCRKKMAIGELGLVCVCGAFESFVSSGLNRWRLVQVWPKRVIERGAEKSP